MKLWRKREKAERVNESNRSVPSDPGLPTGSGRLRVFCECRANFYIDLVVYNDGCRERKAWCTDCGREVKISVTIDPARKEWKSRR